MSNYPKYEIKKSGDNQFYWVLYAANQEPILTSSETYQSKDGCKTGIESSKVNLDDNDFRKLTSTDAQYYFQQVANNKEQLGRSELYTSAQARDGGIASVKKNAPEAGIEDATKMEM